MITCVKDFFSHSVSPLSEIFPPSISITGPTVSNPSPHTSSYYFATPDGRSSSYTTRDSMATPTYDDSPIKKGEYDFVPGNSSFEQENVMNSSEHSGQTSSSSPLMLRRSPQVRRHDRGFVLKESPQSPNMFNHSPQDEDDPLSQSSEKDGAIYAALSIAKPLSNMDQMLFNLNSDDSKMFSCSPTEVESLPFSPSPSNSPKIVSNKPEELSPDSVGLVSVDMFSNKSNSDDKANTVSDDGNSRVGTGLNADVCQLPAGLGSNQLVDDSVEGVVSLVSRNALELDFCKLPDQTQSVRANTCTR